MENPEIAIRLAERGDLPVILEMLRRDTLRSAPEPEGLTAGHLAAFEAIAASDDNELVVATLAGELVGTLQISYIPGLSFDGAWRAQVEGVRVRDDLRGQRIGTRLMEWVVERARARGCHLVQLTTNQARRDAQRFYQRLGFTGSHLGMKKYL